MRTALLLLASSVIACPARADADQDGRKMMGAAAVVLSSTTFGVGDIEIDSPDMAHTAKGVTFRRLAPCVFGISQPAGAGVFLAFVDFSVLTGRLQRHGGVVGYDLRLEGSSPRTRCFDMGEGQAGCQAFVTLPSMDEGQERRIVNDLRYMRRKGCTSSTSERDPY